MKRTFVILLVALFVFGGGYLFFVSQDSSPAFSYIRGSEILSLETRFTPDEIMEGHKKELLGTSLIGSTNRSYKEPEVRYHPYLLFDVKYTDSKHKTRTAEILWSLVDGEMILNTEHFEKTKGFEDLIKAGATPDDFRLLNALAEQKGALSKEKLEKELSVTPDALNRMILQSKAKGLVVIRGSDVLLHFEDPLFFVTPETKMQHALVLKPFREGKKIPSKYSRTKIERIAKAAFGEEFNIREVKEVFLPVIRIAVQNPDGSLLITDWNALTGEKEKGLSFLR